ncbi:NAD-dependent epimerase/dehydratase family protein [Paramicrobacterium chengjingii]|uniref:NAD-dependent epimerase/dehydratase family protein n=1 Tax=Paramicrobacterium chengjingii TaxID=2769067 RepID=UPI0014238A39|nr:NAD(P)-dependent oxidoreductase [Microbacterium chengjingii]
MTTLVTGGAGFIGRLLVKALVEHGHDVVAIDRVECSEAPCLNGAEYRSLDITDRVAITDLIDAVRPERVVHTAAVVGVAASVGSGLLPTIQVNIAGSVNLFEAINSIGSVRRIIDLSSEEYYGTFAADPLPEDAVAAPVSPYGISKFAVERLGGYYAETAGLPYVAARLCWVYGPDFPRTRLPEPWLHDIAEGRNSILEKGGEQRIDFTHIDDVVRGILLLLEAETLEHRAYNIGTGAAYSIRELAAVLHALRPSWNAVVGGGRLDLSPGVEAVTKGAYDLSRIQHELGYEPRVSLREGLERNLALIEERIRSNQQERNKND